VGDGLVELHLEFLALVLDQNRGLIDRQIENENKHGVHLITLRHLKEALAVAVSARNRVLNED